ncbi:MAG: sugar transferase, partial [Cyanobacteria bacterium K_DeepCast_35m_m1_288]|nr:sugar transferase [Cyanobacteria bacterium K_DeepCast_35m_m1_288]
MSWRHTRLLLALCAGLDLAGLLGLIVLNALIKSSSLDHQFAWLLFIACAYCALGWLFGSYTVLRWSRLPLKAAIQRVLITGMVTLLVVAMARLLINPPETIWVLHRSTQITLLMPLMVWSLGLRWVLRRGLLLPPAPRCLLVGQPEETKPVLEAFRRTPVRYRIRTMALEQAVQEPPPLLLAVAPSQLRTPDQLRLLDTLMARDPRDFSLTAPLTLLERVLERLPPALLPEPWLTYDDLPWNQMFSVPRQLKRVADVLIALLLLALLSPLIGCAALLIWLDDHGPVFYSQERSGHLGHP